MLAMMLCYLLCYHMLNSYLLCCVNYLKVSCEVMTDLVRREMKCLSRQSNIWYIQLVALSLCIIRSSFSQSLSDSLVRANYTYPILFPTDRGYRDSAVLANNDCKFTCPYVVVQPETVSLIFTPYYATLHQ
jgi:hypothetical protein